MEKELYIPKKLQVGFVNRTDTYTGKLSYVTYLDEKGVLRKEKSWNSWRDHKIDILSVDNEPIDGFILNKDVQRSGHFGSGRSIVRVYDSRGFEFEVSISNLIGILMHSDISKREVHGKFVFAWAGPELILLPVSSEEYQKSLKHTAKQSKNISTKELIKGATYSTKKDNKNLVYMGYFNYSDSTISDSYIRSSYKGKKHIFYNLSRKSFDNTSLTSMAECIESNCVANYPQLLTKFENSKDAKQVVDVKIEKIEEKDMKSGNFHRFKVFKIIKGTIICVDIGNYSNRIVRDRNSKNLSSLSYYSLETKKEKNVYSANLKHLPYLDTTAIIQLINSILPNNEYSIKEAVDILSNNGFGKIVPKFEDDKSIK